MNTGKKRNEQTPDLDVCGLYPEQVEFIAKYYGIIPAKVIAGILGIPKYKVYRVAAKLGLRAKPGGYPKHVKICKNGENVINNRG